MAIVVNCACGKQFKVKEELAGKRGKCPACGEVLSIPTLAPLVDSEKASPSPRRSCPTCRKALLPSAVICLNCGHDLRTGKQLPNAKSVAPAAPSSPSAKAPASSARLWLALIAGGTCLAGVAAAVTLFSWGRGQGISASAPKADVGPGIQASAPKVDVGPGIQAIAPKVDVGPGIQAIAPKAVARPAILGSGYGRLKAYELKTVSQRMKRIGKDDLKPYFDEWEAGLRALIDSNFSRSQSNMAMGLFAALVDAVWENERFEAVRFHRYVKRLKILPREAVQRWEEELNKVIEPLGDRVRDIDTVGFLIQLEPLFNGEAFRPGESERLLVRLRALRPEAIRTRAEEIDASPSQAAVMLIQQ